MSLSNIHVKKSISKPTAKNPQLCLVFPKLFEFHNFLYSIAVADMKYIGEFTRIWFHTIKEPIGYSNYEERRKNQINADKSDQYWCDVFIANESDILFFRKILEANFKVYKHVILIGSAGSCDPSDFSKLFNVRKAHKSDRGNYGNEFNFKLVSPPSSECTKKSKALSGILNKPRDICSFNFLIERDISKIDFFEDKLLDMETYEFYSAFEFKNSKSMTNCFRFCSDIVREFSVEEYAVLINENNVWKPTGFECKNYSIDSLKKIIRKIMLVNFEIVINLYSEELKCLCAQNFLFSLPIHKNIITDIIRNRKKLIHNLKRKSSTDDKVTMKKKSRLRK